MNDKNLNDLTTSFFGLNKPYCDNLAYWLVSSVNNISADAIDVDKFAKAMSFQIGSEEQASDGSEVLLDFQGISTPTFRLSSVVQFSEKWSPFPEAGKILGEPTLLKVNYKFGIPSVAVLWRNPKIQNPLELSEPYGAWLRALIQNALCTEDSLILVGVQGWSFKHRKLTDLSSKVLAGAGFKQVARAPY